jgi:hypothetical protein
MRVHLWLVLVSLLLVAAASEGAPREPDVDDTHRIDLTASMRVPVRIYNAVSDFSAEDQQVALAVAGKALSTASVAVAWTMCEPGACLTPAPAALMVRVVQSPDAEGDPRYLGHALIDSRTRTGVLATVFIDRTRRVAGDLGLDHRVLLGRAIAHELGHLLLATRTHGSAGLMREVWSRDELLGTHRDDWIFDPSDAAAIRKRLARALGGRPRGAS